tara:strand:- start:426 stop:596 length:171 start_codon:yes stop_codon:yes gene_type:complete
MKGMNKTKNSRNGFFHLYNPKKEGLGTYDIHYINAYKKTERLKELHQEEKIKRYAA